MTRRASAASRQETAPPRAAYRVDEVVAMLGISRSTVYEAIKDGRLKSGNTLGRRLISAASIRATFGEIGE